MTKFFSSEVHYREARCECGRRITVPLNEDWSDPVFVFRAIDDMEKMRSELDDVYSAMRVLANECLSAGVEPTVMRTAKKAFERMHELLAMLEKYPRKKGRQP